MLKHVVATLMALGFIFAMAGATDASYTAYSAAVQALNPLAYYHLSDAASPATDVASSGVILDSATYNDFTPGNFQANDVWSLLGVPGGGDKAPQFDGSAASGGTGTYLSIANSADVLPRTTNAVPATVLADHSYSFFIKKDDTTRRFIGGIRPSSSVFVGLEWVGDGRINLEVRGGSGQNEVDIFSDASLVNLTENTLYHVVISADFNGDDNLQTVGKIFINGVDVTGTHIVREQATPGIPEMDTVDFNIGRWAGVGFYWNGMIDEFAIHNGALTLADAQMLYNAALAKQPGDFDGDGDVDGADFVAWQTNFPKASDALLTEGDADGDGDVDGADFVVWQTNFPFTPGSGVATIPEPAAILLICIGSTGTVLACRAGRADHASRAM